MPRLEGRLPRDVRAELDELLARRPAGLRSISRIHAHLRLDERFGMPLSSLRRYATAFARRPARGTAQNETRPARYCDVEKLLLPDVRPQIDDAILQNAEMTDGPGDVYERFELQRKYGVDRASFDRYAARVLWMGRLSYVGELARRICEHFSADAEAQVQRAAQLVIVGRIIDALSRDDGELPTAELGKLVTMYVSQRKLGEPAVRAAGPRKNDFAIDKSRPLPEGFREAIRQIYGLGLGTGENQLPDAEEAKSSKTEDERREADEGRAATNER